MGITGIRVKVSGRGDLVNKRSAELIDTTFRGLLEYPSVDVDNCSISSDG